MKRLMTAVCCACVLGAAGLSAQADKKMDKMDKMDKGMKSMTVTGCVAEKDGHYMLNHAMMAGESKAMAYDLMGGELKAHVGHKVEVTGSADAKKMGKMDEKMDKKMDKMDKDKMMEKDKMGMSEMHGTLHVQSVKMIAATCP